MTEEYIIARLIKICGIPYNFAQSIVIDLSKRDLLEDLELNLDNIEDYIDIHNIYYRNYLTKNNRG